MKERVKSPVWRVAFVTLLAFGVYGGWALWMNLDYSLTIALTAGLAQGVSSSISTLAISTIIESCYEKFKHHRLGLFLTWLIPPTLTAFMHAGFQWVVGTPEIFITVLLSVIMGYIFGGIYVRGLIKLKQALAEASADLEMNQGSSR
jgi:hypothetical protein